MSYRTPAAEALIDTLICRAVRCSSEADAARKSGEFTKAAVHQGWADATDRVIEDLRAILPDIEEQAELLPPPSAEEWMESEHMAGDLRDWPAA